MITSRNNAFSRCNLKNATLNNSKPIRVNKLVAKHLTYQSSLNIYKHPSVLSIFSWQACDFSSLFKVDQKWRWYKVWRLRGGGGLMFVFDSLNKLILLLLSFCYSLSMEFQELPCSFSWHTHGHENLSKKVAKKNDKCFGRHVHHRTLPYV
jgi:hypothetical protein